MTPRSSGPGGEIHSSPGHTKPPAQQIITVTETPGGFSPGTTSPSQPDRGSATDCLGHFWKADLGHFSQAPKTHIERLFSLRHHSRLDQIEASVAALGKRLHVEARNAA